MGVVYEVENVNTLDRWALKVLVGHALTSPREAARVLKEARTVARLKCDNVVRVIDVDVAPEAGGAPYLVMELLHGGTLAAVASGPRSPAEVVGWLGQVARALGRAHSAGVVHRDLKPENLFLTQREDGSDLIKVLDFGVAKVIDADAASTTQSGAVVGTPLYMSPEQARGESDRIGPAADIWAIGMTAFRLLTGTDYWQGTGSAVLLAKILHEHVCAPSDRGHDLGPKFDEWFLKSCAALPAARWGSVAEQVEALAAAFACEVPRVGSGRSSPWPVSYSLDRPTLSLAGLSRDGRGPGKRKWVWHAVAAAAVLAALVAIATTRPRAPVVSPAAAAPPLAVSMFPTANSAADAASSPAVPTATAGDGRPARRPRLRAPAPAAGPQPTVADPDPLADPH